MKYLSTSFWLIISTLIFTSCGSGSGTDPHLTAQELNELQEAAEINLVGKWKLRRPTSSFSKTFVATNSCDVYQIEFLENDTYLLNVSYTSDGHSELSYQLFRGSYDVQFTDSETEATIERVVLMGSEYQTTTSVPEQGSVATISEIEINEVTNSISFSIKLEADTAALCLTSSVVSLAGDKETKPEANAPEDSNHIKIQNDWRMTQIITSVGGNSSSSDLCAFYLDEYNDRCFDETTQELQADCPKPTTLTLLFSGYGTYLMVYYDAAGAVVSSDQGEWRWLPNADVPYTSFQVRFEDDNWDEAITLVISELTETTMQINESSSYTDDSGVSFESDILYNFQLASLPFSSSSCSGS